MRYEFLIVFSFRSIQTYTLKSYLYRSKDYVRLSYLDQSPIHVSYRGSFSTPLPRETVNNISLSPASTRKLVLFKPDCPAVF